MLSFSRFPHRFNCQWLARTFRTVARPQPKTGRTLWVARGFSPRLGVQISFAGRGLKHRATAGIVASVNNPNRYYHALWQRLGGGCKISGLALALWGLSLPTSVAAADAPAITPRQPIVLFNGKDLSSFFTWEAKHGREDPDRVFTVVDQIDGAPAIRGSGQYFGGLITNDRYTNYRLVVEFRWGNVTWEPRKDRSRDAGILLHCQGDPGNNTPDFRAPWMRSVEFQFIEGGTGDIILVGGYDRGKPELIFPTLKAMVTPGTRIWNPAGTLGEFGKGKNRVDWRHKDREWKDVLGFRGREDVEKPVGQWNRIEAICASGNVTYFLNGVKVNEARDGSFTEGRILFQTEGAEVFYRGIELHPLGK